MLSRGQHTRVQGSTKPGFPDKQVSAINTAVAPVFAECLSGIWVSKKKLMMSVVLSLRELNFPTDAVPVIFSSLRRWTPFASWVITLIIYLTTEGGGGGGCTLWCWCTDVKASSPCLTGILPSAVCQQNDGSARLVRTHPLKTTTTTFI